MTSITGMKVFLSSTFEDLKEYRQKAIEVVNTYKCVPLAMEFFNSLSADPQKVCDEEIKDCDIFIGIYAYHFGWAPGDGKKSITQLEYELAKELKKDRLCFIVDKNALWLPASIQFDKQKELKAFLDTIKSDLAISFFKDPIDLKAKVAASLGKLLAEKKLSSQKGETGKSVPTVPQIPQAPHPYIVHPYPLPENFTGRTKEMATLSKWFYKETHPLMVIEAIGGMGKSALSWAWLQNEIISKNPIIAGVFWWSFYDAPFELFLPQLARYVTGARIINDEALFNMHATLHSIKFLLVLDGLERALRGFAGMEAMFMQEKRFERDTETEA